LKDFYIGDFINADEDKYQQKKKKDEEGQMSLVQKLILICIFVGAFAFLYSYLTKDTPLTPGTTGAEM
jgi:hypothetical protein